MTTASRFGKRAGCCKYAASGLSALRQTCDLSSYSPALLPTATGERSRIAALVYRHRLIVERWPLSIADVGWPFSHRCRGRLPSVRGGNNPVNHERTYRVGHLFCGIGPGPRASTRPTRGSHGIRAVRVRRRCRRRRGRDQQLRAADRDARARSSTCSAASSSSSSTVTSRRPTGARRRRPTISGGPRRSQPLDVMFLSAPCKGFSGLLSTKASGTRRNIRRSTS
jgi:hypothetical protein